MLQSCQEGTGYGHNKSGVRGELAIRPNLPVYTRDARGSAMMSVLKAALGVSEIVRLTCESGLFPSLSIRQVPTFSLTLTPFSDNELTLDGVHSYISVTTVF